MVETLEILTIQTPPAQSPDCRIPLSKESADPPPRKLCQGSGLPTVLCGHPASSTVRVPPPPPEAAPAAAEDTEDPAVGIGNDPPPNTSFNVWLLANQGFF